MRGVEVEVTTSDEDGTPLVKVLVEYVDAGIEKTERFWAKPLGGDLYEVRNTPWYLYGLNWGDTVRCAELSTDEVPRVIDVVSRSGHKTLRVIFNHDRLTPERQDELLATLSEMHAHHERANPDLLAIDVEPQADYQAVFDFLARCTDEGLLVFEEAWQPVVGGGFGPT
jgi:hypothetical protein